MSVVGRLKEELSGVGLKVWTMCLRCSWSTSIRDTCTVKERGGEGVCTHIICGSRCLSCVYIHVYTWLGVHACVCVCAHTWLGVHACVHVCVRAH